MAVFLWPTTIHLVAAAEAMPRPGIAEVLKNLVLNIVDNPVKALANANYIGILSWAIALGFILRNANDTTREIIQDFSEAVTTVVRIVIRIAPFGISVGREHGRYGRSRRLRGLRPSCFSSSWAACSHRPRGLPDHGLVLHPQESVSARDPVLRVSGICAFFTRSSAANIPVNLDLCRKLKLDEGTYSISIPIGATVNMGGAAITITILTLAAANSLGVQVDFWTAICSASCLRSAPAAPPVFRAAP